MCTPLGSKTISQQLQTLNNYSIYQCYTQIVVGRVSVIIPPKTICQKNIYHFPNVYAIKCMWIGHKYLYTYAIFCFMVFFASFNIVTILENGTHLSRSSMANLHFKPRPISV